MKLENIVQIMKLENIVSKPDKLTATGETLGEFEAGHGRFSIEEFAEDLQF